MAIHDYIQNNDVETLHKVLKTSVESVEEKTGDQQNTPLHIAARVGNPIIVSLLLKCGANIHQQNKRKVSPAQVAINYNKLEVLKVLLQHDSSILNKTDLRGDSLLMLATQRGHADIVKYLIQLRANAGIRNLDGNTMFHHAAQRNRWKILLFLAKYGKDYVNVPNKKGYTALHIGAMKGYDEIVKILLMEGASRNVKAADGKIPDMLAPVKTKTIFKLFTDYKYIEQSCACGMAPLLGSKLFEGNQTALHIVASFTNSKSLLRKLSSSVSNINALNYEKMTPLHVAISSMNVENVDVILKNGGNVNQPEGNNGNTPLHLACRNNAHDCAKLLIHHKADVTKRNNEGLTPLMYAIKYHALTVTDYLIEIGADKSSKDLSSNTLLHQAVIANSPHISEILLNKTPQDLASTNKDKDTPLMLAVKMDHATLAKMFLKHGCNGQWKNEKGISAYSLALQSRNKKLIDCFENSHSTDS